MKLKVIKDKKYKDDIAKMKKFLLTAKLSCFDDNLQPLSKDTKIFISKDVQEILDAINRP